MQTKTTGRQCLRVLTLCKSTVITDRTPTPNQIQHWTAAKARLAGEKRFIGATVTVSKRGMVRALLLPQSLKTLRKLRWRWILKLSSSALGIFLLRQKTISGIHDSRKLLETRRSVLTRRSKPRRHVWTPSSTTSSSESHFFCSAAVLSIAAVLRGTEIIFYGR